jgi:hypothetical protein
MAKKPEIYVSVDIEADGPIPGPHSMLSIGAVAYNQAGEEIDHYSANLETLEGASAHPRMEAWWQHFPEAWAACRENTRPPQAVMTEFADWIERLQGNPIFTAWPATWDFMWIYWYLLRFTDRRSFGEHGIDMRSYAMGMRKKSFRESGKPYLPKRWFSEQEHNHIALDDAREQGELFVSMLRENLELDASSQGDEKD